MFKKLFQAIFNIGQHLKGADRIEQVKGSIKNKKTEKQATTKVTACLKQRPIKKYKNKSITNNDDV